MSRTRVPGDGPKCWCGEEATFGGYCNSHHPMDRPGATNAPASPVQEGDRVNAEFGHHVVLSASRELEKLGALIANWKKTTDECFDLKDARITKLESDLATLQAAHDALVAERVSNHEAWEQGARIGWDCALGDMGDEEYQFSDVETQNPFPKPEKKESCDGNG